MATPLTGFRTFFAQLSPSWLQGNFGSKYVAGVIGLFGDMIQNIANMGVKAPWLKTDTSPNDALPLGGEGANLPRYFTDTDVTYRDRLNDRWNTWELAGTKAQLESQAVLMGFPNAQVFEPADWPGIDGGYWSQFWLFIPESDHSFTGGIAFDSGATFDDGSLFDISGTNAFEIINSLNTAMCLFKPGHVRFNSIIFESSGTPTFDTGHVFDEPGLVFGSVDNIAIPGSC